jgi:branched-chain amino acid transport system substrate-binding protein
MASIQEGELLALEQAHRADRDLNVDLLPLDDAPSPVSSGGWSPSQAQASVDTVTRDRDAIAYIGDYDSGATATTLPSTNRAGILQVSPWSPYVGLTDLNPVDGIGQPGAYYPSGARTFARLVPSDVKEAQATTSFMQQLGISSVYVLSDNSPYNGPFDSAIAPLVASDAAKAGITLAGQAQVDTAATTQPAGYASVVAAILASHASAVFVGAEPGPGAVALWQALFDGLPGVALFAPSTLAIGPFLDKLGAATADTYVTSPILPADQYPRSGQAILSLLKRRYGTYSRYGTYPYPEALYGYEAMKSILDAINIAGKNATKPLALIHTYFHLGTRDKSVIGRYYITRTGDSSLSKFAGYRVGEDGHLIEIRRFNVG